MRCKDWFEDIARWQRHAFPSATPVSCYRHLVDEVTEVGYEMAGFQIIPDEGVQRRIRGKVADELADVFFLTLALAHTAGIDLHAAIEEKFERNKQRTFVYDPVRGYAKGSPE